MSKALLNIDAAYALGEEAFRAGFRANTDGCLGCSPEVYAKAEQAAWDAFEPSETVKDLINVS